ncbi:putative Phage head-tail adaptor [Listeria monocytogenes]|uniref:head-tail adaptor protein n=1 Tax=Listeria monocytogenes TaxID=1639 RepID=UPI00074D64F9|nr:head-tail adaptor protein [Listeria monocytogenes]EAE7887194.1 head-tail adaptor protein [Listeria monocytogenes]EJQ6756040.1 head-tail adaptor protein [Listeria monocytogenes]CUL88485.1 putative Phage head-tail adaptor [Listeria monocytogenes]HEN3926906.1 head-tail adaptor protein [Listeria monocytogenes]HEN3936239.1 head-tail adaptor protein [Listeria monocytogenes]
MSFGKMNGFADIKTMVKTKDNEGFSTTSEMVIASIRVYREGRHGSERWANLAAFSEATDLFRFRTIPGVEVTTEHFIESDGELFDITSVENVKGRGMYTEVLAKKVVSSIGKS